MVQEANSIREAAAMVAVSFAGRLPPAASVGLGGGKIDSPSVAVPLSTRALDGQVHSRQKAAAPVRASHAQFAWLQEAKEAMQQQAITARQDIARADAMQRLLREMRDNLHGIIKHYPPFPYGSEERERFLKLVTGLRQQMEALLVPPPENRHTLVPEEAKEWLPPILNGASSDADLAMAVNAIEAQSKAVQSFGAALREQWIAMAQPDGEASALALSAALGAGLALASQAIGAGMRSG